MEKFEIVVDSSNDLSEKIINENNIKVASFYLTLDGENYLQDQVDITREEMYRELRANKDLYPKTSLPSVDSFYQLFKSGAEEGRDAICFTISSKLSGTYQSANIAANSIMEEYKDINIYVIDSQSASLGVGILAEKAAEYRKENIDIKTVYEKIKPVTDTAEVYIALDTLSYLEKGGRIGKTSAFAGNLLKLKPIVSLIDNELGVSGAARGSKKAIEKILELLDNRIKDNPKGYRMFVVHGDNEETAKKVKSIIEEKYNIEITSEISLVSPTVISHIGPGAVAIGCMEEF